MTSYNLSSFAGAGAQFFDDNGNPLSGGKIFTYEAGTTSPLATYTTTIGDVANTNPIILDAAGRTPNEIWLAVGTLYKFILKTSTDVLIGTYDGIPAINDPYSINSLLGSITGTNAIAAAATPAITAYASGATYAFIAANTNTAAATISIDGLTAKSITKNGSAALTAGDIQAGKLTWIQYDGTTFQLLNNIVYGGSVVNGTLTGGTATSLTLVASTITSLTAALPVSSGGTGQTSYTNGQLLIGNTTGNTLTKTTLTAGNNVTITNGAGSVTISSASITLGTAVASTSGTSIDFTSIPANVKRVTIMFQGVSTSGTSSVQVQLGTTSGVETTNYLGASVAFASAQANTLTYTSGAVLNTGGDAATSVRHGFVQLCNLTGNVWTIFGGLGHSDTTRAAIVMYSKAAAAVLDRVRITTINGTDTFDAGTINIMWET
jgi:hypothetical protein